MAERPYSVPRWLAALSAWCKHAAAVAAVLAVVGSGVWAFAEPQIIRWIAEKTGPLQSVGGPCAAIPKEGHSITGATPGSWGAVEWRGIIRLREDCGVPIVTGVMTNGGGFYHDAPLSISGVPLPVGANDLPYRFYVSEKAYHGLARFQVVVTFPDAVGGAPPAISPWLSFLIDNPEPPT